MGTLVAIILIAAVVLLFAGGVILLLQLASFGRRSDENADAADLVRDNESGGDWTR